MSDHQNALGQPIGAPLKTWKPCERPRRTTMQGSDCRLEPLSAESHAVDLFEAYQSDREGRVWTYLPIGPFDSFAPFEKWIADCAASEDPLFYAVVDEKSGKAIGYASYLRIDPANGVIEVGRITYSPLLQKNRAATEAMYLMMKRVFSELGYRRYEWKCDNLNAPSRAAAERLGFVFEGVFRQAVVYKNRNRDTAWFSITDTEWPALEAAFKAWLSSDNHDSNGQQIKSLKDMRS